MGVNGCVRIAMTLWIACSALAALPGCVSTPAPVWTGESPEALVAKIRADRRFEGDRNVPAELDIQPLRDLAIEDLLAQAERAEAGGQPQASASALDRALALSPQDPALMQARAETALLLRDLDTADRLSRDAHAIGAQIGPLCRRHWLTAAAVAHQRAAQRRGQADASRRESDRSAFADQAASQAGLAAEAERRADDCMLTGPARY